MAIYVRSTACGVATALNAASQCEGCAHAPATIVMTVPSHIDHAEYLERFRMALATQPCNCGRFTFGSPSLCLVTERLRTYRPIPSAASESEWAEHVYSNTRYSTQPEAALCLSLVEYPCHSKFDACRRVLESIRLFK